MGWEDNQPVKSFEEALEALESPEMGANRQCLLWLWLTYPLMISLVSALIKCSLSGVRMQRENFCPVRASPSTTSVHWFMLMVP